MKNAKRGRLAPVVRGLEPEDENYIGNLSPQWPLDEELISQGDDHLRAINRAMTNSFPNFGNDAVKLTAAEINSIVSGTNDVGTITYWDGAIDAIPFGYYICDGETHAGYETPPLVDNYVRGGSLESIGDIGGNNQFTITTGSHELSLAEMPSHRHTFRAHDNNSQEESEFGRDNNGLDRGTWNNYPTPFQGDGLGHEHELEIINDPLFSTLIPIIFLGV